MEFKKKNSCNHYFHEAYHEERNVMQQCSHEENIEHRNLPLCSTIFRDVVYISTKLIGNIFFFFASITHTH